MKILFENISVLTMTDDNIIENAYVCVNESKIEYIGHKRPDTNDFDKVINGSGKLIMPGLINCHVHSPMGIMRGYAEGLDLQDWLNQKIFPAEAKLLEDDIYWCSLLGISEMISTGTTAFNDMYFLTHSTARAVEETKIRAYLNYCGTCFDEQPDLENIACIQNNRRLFEDYKNYKNDLITVSVSPHAIYTCSDKFLEFQANEAKRLGTFVHTHLSETVLENEECISKNKKTPAEHMRDLGLFDTPCVAAHCVHLTNLDMDILKKYNVSVVHNPTSNLKLASGICDTARLIAKGVNVALGTDGASSNNNLNMFEELHMATILQKGVHLDSTLICPFDALKMATVNGAKAMLSDDKIGTLETGKYADLIVVDLDKPHLYPNHNTVSLLAYSAQASDVYMTMTAGEILYENGEFKTLDFEKIKFNIDKIFKRIF